MGRSSQESLSLFPRPDWHDEPGDHTWIAEVLRGDEPLAKIEIERLYQLLGQRGEYETLDAEAAAEAAARGEPLGRDYPKVRRPVYDRLVPSPIVAQSEHPERAERFLKLWAADPVRTDVLCYLTVQKAAEWLRQHFPAERVAAIQAEAHRRLASNVDDLAADDQAKNAWLAGERLAKIDLAEQLHRLIARHGKQAGQVTSFLRSLTDEEMEEFKQATGLRIIDYAPLTSYVEPIRNPMR